MSSSPILLASPFIIPSRPRVLSIQKTRRLEQQHPKLLVLACKEDNSGRLVDKNMIVLRKRIRETKMDEIKYEPPLHWMDWEKRHYSRYDAYVYEMVGVLQSSLMNTRPGLALGLMALIALSVPLSTLVVVSNAMEITKGILCRVLH